MGCSAVVQGKQGTEWVHLIYTINHALLFHHRRESWHADIGPGIRNPADLAAEPVLVNNGPEPSRTIRYWHLKEEWRAGPEDEDYLFGFIVDVVVDSVGNTYVLDFQQQETYVFDPAGK